MPLSPEIQKKVLDAAKEGKYEDAADLLVGFSKEETSYDEVLDIFKRVGASINQGAISNIFKIYTENSNNIPALKEKLGNLVSTHNVNSAGAEGERSTNPETIEEKQIPEAIAALRKKQKDEISKSGKPNEQLAKQLNILINRQVALSKDGNEPKIKVSTKSPIEEKKDTTPKPGSKNWFVLPDFSKADEDIRVVTGSPMIQELRKRYEQKYSRIRDDMRKENKGMSVEDQFTRKKELDRERAFIESYKDSTAIEDQDIYAHQIASSFITDKYETVLPVVDLEDKGKKYYGFAGGRLVCNYNMETKKYTLSVEGEISGAFSVLLHRKTDSGRIIDEAYDIVEFRNGISSMYAKSSKGNLAISNIDDITRSANQSKIDLRIPIPSIIEDSKNVSRKEEVETAEKVPDKQANIFDKSSSAQAPPAPESPEVQAPPSPFSPPEENIAAPKADNNAGYLRSQLQSFKSKPTSETTMRYIAAQLAEAEDKKIEDVCKEFGITPPNVKKSKEPEEKPAPHQELKEKKEAPIKKKIKSVALKKKKIPKNLETQIMPKDLESRVTRLEQEVRRISSSIQSQEGQSKETTKEKKSKSNPKEKESPLKDTVKKLLSKNKVKPKKLEENNVDESSMKKIKARLSSAFNAKKKSTGLKPITEQQSKRKR